MIKVQPAGSRIVRSESPSQITLTNPARGLLSVGGILVLIAVAWAAGMTWVMLGIEDKIFQIGAGFLLLPAAAIGITGVTMCVLRWSFERSADWVVFTRGGLWGPRVRKWPAQDVSSFWVDDVKAGDGPTYSTLSIGFRNGRREDLLVATGMGEDFRWIAAVLKDPKGTRKVPPTARGVAEPPVRKVDPAVVPSTMTLRRFPTGVELVFLPLLDFKRRWWKLLGIAVAGIGLLLGASSLLVALLGPSYPLWITRVGVLALLCAVLNRFMVWRRTTVIQVLDGIVTVVQNHARGNHQFPVGEVEFIQTFRNSGNTELQFLIRGKRKVRLVEDRSGDELEWAARFLRVALKGRPDEQESPLKMETAAGQCQVCGEKMESRVIFCAKCRTPHHEECWSYIGQCSTFGCREIRFTRT